MELIVLKFGGTSISNREGFSKSLQHIKKELILKNKVICVVSAMGRDESPYATDTLKNLLKNYVSKKEQDRLLSIGEIISSILFTDYLIENQKDNSVEILSLLNELKNNLGLDYLDKIKAATKLNTQEVVIAIENIA